MKTIQDILSIHPLFKDFSKNQIQTLLDTEGVIIKPYQKSQVIHLQNDVCHSLGIIINGHVAIENIDEDGHVLIITEFHANDIFGANLLFSKRPLYPMTVTSHKPSLVLHIEKDAVIALCHKHQSFMLGLFQILSDRTLILSDKIHQLHAKTLRQKITDYIKDEAEVQGSHTILLPFSKKNLAERFGVQRSSLGRELKKMKEEGLLDFDSASITWKHM